MVSRMAVARAVCADVDWSAVDRSMQVATTSTVARANARRRSLADSMSRPIDPEALRFVMDGLEVAYSRQMQGIPLTDHLGTVLLSDMLRMAEIERLAMKLNWKPEQETDEMTSYAASPAASSFVDAKSLRGTEHFVTISAYELRSFEEQGRDGSKYMNTKVVLSFEGKGKKWIMPKICSTMMAGSFGDEMDGWLGRQIILFEDPNIQFGSKLVSGVRWKLPVSAVTAPFTDGLGQPAQMPAQQQAAPPAERPIGGLGAQAPDPFEPAPAQGAPVSPAADLDDEIPF